MIDEEEKSTTRALITVTRGRDSLASLFAGLVERLTSGALCRSVSVLFFLFLLFFHRRFSSSASVISVLPYIAARRVHTGLTRA